MGLTNQSTGSAGVPKDIVIESKNDKEKVIAIAGNPNVGKSTVFNSLTGLKQHTGNWPGKTVENAQGEYEHRGVKFRLVDIPGTYSLMANSVEEEVARDFICFGNADAVIVVMDATCIERNLNLVLQILEVTRNVVVCVNLMDEAKRKGIQVDIDELSLQLGVPVVGTSARSGEGLNELMDEVYNISCHGKLTFYVKTDYGEEIESAIKNIQEHISPIIGDKIDTRFLSLRLLDIDEKLRESLSSYIGEDILKNEDALNKIKEELDNIEKSGINKEEIRDVIVLKIVQKAEKIYKQVVKVNNKEYNSRDRKIDKILTSKKTGIPIMILLLMGIFWLTITGANYPSELIASGLFWLQDRLTDMFNYFNAPSWLHGILVLGMYRTLAWVVSVMLPPMAIFFPLFTLLEDVGYLPRVAFNMDKMFKKAHAHGKQALTM